MEREVWDTLCKRLRHLRDRRPAKCQFTDQDIVRVFLWATLHDRPVSWACRPGAWPRRPRRLPTPSTMTRRLRTLSVMTTLRRLAPRPRGRSLVCVDGKPLTVSRFSKDRQASYGYAVGGMGRGYKLHAACDSRGNLLAFDVRPINEAECMVARRLIARAASAGSVILADASYDSNPLHAVAGARGATLLAPRRKPGRGLGHHPQEPGRLRSMAVLEGDRRKRRQASRLRGSVERFFGWLTGIGGGSPPAWVRTLPRVRRWVIAKLAILHALREP